MPKNFKQNPKYKREISKLIKKVEKLKRKPIGITSNQVMQSVNSWNEYQKAKSNIKKLSNGYTELNRSQVGKLSALVKQFNEKANGTNISKLNYDQVRNLIKSKSDYNQVMRTYGSFLKDGAEDIKFVNSAGVKVSKWEIQNYQRLLKSANKNTEKINGQIIRKIGFGYESDYYTRQLNDISTTFKSNMDFQKAIMNVLKRSSNQYKAQRVSQYQQNLIKAARNIYDENIKKDFINRIITMTAEELQKLRVSDPAISIEWFYEVTEEWNFDSKAQEIIYRIDDREEVLNG